MKTIDLAAVVVEVGQKESFVSKSDGTTRFKLKWTVVDDSGYAILVTLWGSEFIDKYASIKAGDVVGVKAAKVTAFGGKSLNISNGSQVYIDADHKRIKSITQWYSDRCDDAGDNDVFTSMLAQSQPLTETMTRMNIDTEE